MSLNAISACGGQTQGIHNPDVRPYELHLYQVLATPVRESGLTARIRIEFYDSQLGTAPAAGEIRLHADFVVQETM